MRPLLLIATLLVASSCSLFDPIDRSESPTPDDGQTIDMRAEDLAPTIDMREQVDRRDLLDQRPPADMRVELDMSAVDMRAPLDLGGEQMSTADMPGEDMASDLGPDMPPAGDPDLIGHWTMDSIMQGQLPNSGSDPSLGGLQVYGLSLADGHTGAAGDRSIDCAANHWAILPHNDALATDEFTLGLWLRPETVNSSFGLWSKDAKGTSVGDLSAFLAGGYAQLLLGDGNATNNVTSGKRARQMQWHHLAFSIGPAGTKLYWDGALVASRDTVSALTDNDEPLLICGSATLSEPGTVFDTNQTRPYNLFVGRIDEMRLYARQLDDFAIFQLASP